MSLRVLPDGPRPRATRPGLFGEEHRCRALLGGLLSGDADAARSLAQEYDQQSATWQEWTRGQADYLVPLSDALERAPLPERCDTIVEVSCGTGEATELLSDRRGPLLATDISLAMLVNARPLPGVSYAVADVRCLPLADQSVDVLVGLNAVPDPLEWQRVLRPQGTILWVSSFGPETPLYVEPAALARAWEGPAAMARAGHGDWTCLTRP